MYVHIYYLSLCIYVCTYILYIYMYVCTYMYVYTYIHEVSALMHTCHAFTPATHDAGTLLRSLVGWNRYVYVYICKCAHVYIIYIGEAQPQTDSGEVTDDQHHR